MLSLVFVLIGVVIFYSFMKIGAKISDKVCYNEKPGKIIGGILGALIGFIFIGLAVASI